MLDIDVAALIRKIAQVGANNHLRPDLSAVEPFQHYFSAGVLAPQALDKRDGGCTRREILLRYLLLSAVLDQGPDVEGVRLLLRDVTNQLYRSEVRFLHKPTSFFASLGVSLDKIDSIHEAVKRLRASDWAKDNQSSSQKYSLFLDNSHQILNYVIFRWGVPLALPILLEYEADGKAEHADALHKHLSSMPSAERMSDCLKSDKRYGLGKAIGNKACHLFAKWTVTSFGLLRKDDNKGWGDYSYEVPFDSNAGRVLWRTGFFLHWAEPSYYMQKNVLQPNRGKNNTTYIRVTNVRGTRTKRDLPAEIVTCYSDLCRNHLMTSKREPRYREIQRIPGAYLLMEKEIGGGTYTIEDFDDGLMHVGTSFCFNHGEPNCDGCPLGTACHAKASDQSLIKDYRS